MKKKSPLVQFFFLNLIIYIIQRILCSVLYAATASGIELNELSNHTFQ